VRSLRRRGVLVMQAVAGLFAKMFGKGKGGRDSDRPRRARRSVEADAAD